MNSTHQYNKTEENLQLDKLSEMGIVYVENAISKASEKARIAVQEWLQNQTDPVPSESEITNHYINYLDAALKNFDLNPELEIVMNDSDFRFKIEINHINIENNTDIKVNYTITSSLNSEYDERNSFEGERIINLDY